MSRAGAQILLSRHDLTPLAIAEAAVYAKATIATMVGGIPEMILDGKTGWLIRPEAKPAEIGEIIAKIFKEQNSLVRNGGEARSDSVPEQWNWQAVGETLYRNRWSKKY